MMKKIFNKLFSIFGVFLLGTILFWAIGLTFYEIWIELQSETVNYGTIECDSATGEKKIVWIDPEAKEKRKKEIADSFWGTGYLKSYKEFGPLKIGDQDPNGPGTKAQFDNKLVPESEFYIYVQRRGLRMCEFDSCAIAEGKVVECMGGWLQGDGHHEVSDIVGLDSSEVAQGKASIVVISDKKGKIIGIYPYHSEGDTLSILAQYPEYEESLQSCRDEIIGKLQ